MLATALAAICAGLVVVLDQVIDGDGDVNQATAGFALLGVLLITYGAIPPMPAWVRWFNRWSSPGEMEDVESNEAKVIVSGVICLLAALASTLPGFG